jgi:hypothetical protein
MLSLCLRDFSEGYLWLKGGDRRWNWEEDERNQKGGGHVAVFRVELTVLIGAKR